MTSRHHTQALRITRARPRTVAAAAPGRPRDERIDAEVVAAVFRALENGGYRAVTIEGIAQKLGRARTTLYRRWPSKRHLVAYAVVSEMGDNPASDTGNLRADLRAAVDTLVHAFAGPLGRAMAGLVADMAQDPALAALIRKQVLARRRKSMREAIERAQARGEAARNIDVELVLDMLTGPFYFRTLFAHATISRQTARRVVDYVVGILQHVGPGRR
jgi:AcrR family transcriptional regulator